jgi:thymidylate synthase
MNEKEWIKHCLKLQEQYSVFTKEYEERAAQGKVGVIERGGNGDIPVLFANGNSLAEAWENSLIALWVKGIFLRTEYDRKDSKGEFIDPPSKDATMIMAIKNPMAEPRIHRCFPGGINDLEEYRQEVLDGIKDSWIRNPNNPEDKRWEYTYHERMFKYKVPGLEQTIDQFNGMIKNLAKSPITRRAQIVSWKPWEDVHISDPACFQSLWGRILRQHPEGEFKFYSDEKTGKSKLNFNMRFRSRDGYEAAFMNGYAFTYLGEEATKQISEIRGEEVTLGRFLDISDAYHIYGQATQDFLDRFGKGLETRHFLPKGEYDKQSRTWMSNSGLVQDIFKEAQSEIVRKVASQNEKYAQGKELTKDSTQLFK